ncbi:hypothetical protein L2E82_16580 [Cichorium intybus]|uniref:Uncharacterized protein n=1 Tax=Cichorium intybus TaxID=13427 RepID=A0ACB9F5Y0_CICIN|nr:hypothetical protein L2E82_16580 [Cichorium intybus]
MRLIKERKQQENVKVQDDDERHQIMEKDTTSAKKLLDDLFAHLALKGFDENMGIVLEEFKYSSDEFAYSKLNTIIAKLKRDPLVDDQFKSKNLFKELNCKLDMMTDALNNFIIASGNFVQSSSSTDVLSKLVNQSFVKVFDQLKDIQEDMSAMGFVHDEGPSIGVELVRSKRAEMFIAEGVSEANSGGFKGDMGLQCTFHPSSLP